MSIRVALTHHTRYTYDRLVALGPQTVRLRPAPHCRTPILGYSLKVSPTDHFINWQQDPHGNFLARFVFPEKTRELCLDVEVIADMTVINPFDFYLEPEALEFPFTYSDALKKELQVYLHQQPATPALEAFMAAVPHKAKGTVDFLVDVNRLVQQEIKYLIRLEPGVQTPEETLTNRSGSCRDSAWLLVEVLRHLGLAARFVSGYLIQLTPDIKALDGPVGTAVDFTDLHAWTEVYLPGAGWVGLDPTSGLMAGEGHLPLAATPEPGTAAPISGGVDECETEFEFEMRVDRIFETPRVTKPYTETQWQSLLSLGTAVDEELKAGPNVMTMGGEPTFVSIDDPDGDEWNTAAVGPNKRKLAGDLFKRLAKRFANGPLLHYGQGKWYPGEQLPRWALGCYWRKDGEPIWRNQQLYAEDIGSNQANAADAGEFIAALAERLDVDLGHVVPGYEDVWYYLWREKKLPTNVDPLRSNLKDPEERSRLAKVFKQGLDRVVGYALPIKPTERREQRIGWESGPWSFRQGQMFLIPGDSPMGLRLPLDSLPWHKPSDEDVIYERDPLAEREPLRSQLGPNGSVRNAEHVLWSPGSDRDLWSQDSVARQATDLDQVRYPQSPLNGDQHATYGGSGNQRAEQTSSPVAATALATEPATQTRTAQQTEQQQLIRTAICVETRNGILHVFMPPVALVEDYLDLVTALEETAAELRQPIRIEGYPPPHDYRVDNFKVTPDPGVIEVNLQPAANWDQLVENMTVLHEEARHARLTAEKFMVDGRHAGTGGGNHIVIGGPTPAESPFLKRPDLLRSFLGVWNNRPSLSYLFSGLFIGPTSQAPRVDEARHESIYELETAFAQLPEDADGKVTDCPPWLVDRAFRHLLVDLTGNTHRAEFCIDKLYSPDSSTGRLGLVEFRGFEMPPHERMNLAQYLLIRAMVAKFWKTPYREPLVRWETTLHDRFMLPWFVGNDFSEVLDELRDAGYPFDPQTFAPHFEFRFPVLGEMVRQGIQFELRQAVEPWHVLGEEPGGGGAVRYVDSSVERVQVLVRGMTDDRHIVACNGRRVPLHPTGVRGEFVAGVRFRAWQPPTCLHPTIPSQAPLVFDIVDTWNSRSIGGCTWYVGHPGGRNSEDFPVNANAAESRRVARFWPIGHTQGRIELPPDEHNPDYPLTLDLRRPLAAGIGR